MTTRTEHPVAAATTAVLVAVMMLCAPTPTFAQRTDPAPPMEPTLRTFFPDLWGDVQRLPSTEVAVSTTIGGILSASVLPFDTDASNWQPDSAFKAGKWVGNAGVLAAATLTAYGVGAWGDKPRVRHAADDALRAQILALGITYGLKYTVQRERPDQSGHDSFPSGHTAETFAVATVLARHFGPAIWIPAYGVAGYVAASRINQHRHYVSDVTFAAGLGVAVGWNGKGHPGGWALEPRVSPHEAGLQMSRVFAP